VEARLRPVNTLLGLTTRGNLIQPVLADIGFRVAGLEIPVVLGADRVVIDLLLVHDLTAHLVACEAKSGANVDAAQARKYACLDAQQVVLAGSVDLPRRIAPTVEPLFACLAPNSARIRTGLARAGVRAALVAVGPRSVTLENPDQAGRLLADALQEPVPLPVGISRIVAYDQDSPLDVVRPAVDAVLVAHLSRRTPQASSATIAEQTAPWLTAYGKRARHAFRRKVEDALRRIAADELGLFEYRGRTANRDPLVRFLSTPEDNDPRGRTQAYQALARPAHTRRRTRPAENPDQLDLLAELQEADDVGDIEDGRTREEGP
jgi:hypothetical protein